MMKPGRNHLCSCGSGNKFKKCCGKVLAIIPARQPAANTNQRQCGSCTACCDGWLASTIYGHDMKPGQPCHFVQAGGCSIYERRPDSPCREFACTWVVPDSPLPDSFKPDQLGIIIIAIKWRGQQAYRLCSAGRDPDPALLAWMANFSRHTGRPFFYEEAGETLGYGSPAFQQELLEHLRTGQALW